MLAIHCDKVTKSYGEKVILDGVSLEVPEGKIFGLLGPNGAGKTTLIRIINQITGPDSGSVSFFGEKLSRHHISRVGYLPEERGLYRKMKVGEQALYLAQLKGLSAADARKKLRYWFEKMDIIDWWDKEVQALSKGMAQKVQFIVTVLHEPDLLIFDEPFSGFDPVNANLIKDEILEINQKGTTIMFSTHRMESVEALCENIALVNQSQVILQSPLRALKESYRSNAWVVEWFGESLPSQWPQDVELVDYEFLGGRYTIQFRIHSQSAVSNLVSVLMAQGTLFGLQEKLPSLQDIFIERVTNKTNG
ncbi:MAG: ATP-binding cassette domain-containing protein [Flavobacteriales bacterium]|nr:MAG: ATP-binding cassette domain-containing protein [Flavobacteriales bacterium]